MRLRVTFCAVLLALANSKIPAYSQQPAQPGESHKYRVILSIAGAGGGFTLGVFAGIAAFDDATYASRKVWTTALISAAAGGAGGYFIGRALDKSRAKSGASPQVTSWAPDALDRSLMRAHVAAVRSSRFKTSPPPDSRIRGNDFDPARPQNVQGPAPGP